MLYRFVAQEQ